MTYTVRMIRVTFAEREPEDVPANRATTTADGSLVLEWMDLGEVVNPQTLQRQTVVTALAWVRTYSRATGWLTAAPAPAEEPAEDLEPELEEAIR